MTGSIVQTVIAAIVWLVANVVYLDLKRKGIRGFTRFAAFWAGTPTTWITFFAVREGRQPTFRPEASDEELLARVRRDRALRSGGERGTGAVGPGGVGPADPDGSRGEGDAEIENRRSGREGAP